MFEHSLDRTHKNTLFQCIYFSFLTLFQVNNGIKITFFQDLKSVFSMIYSVFTIGKVSSAYTHEAVGSVSIATVVDEGGVSVSGFVERAF